jgi:hypothetical protein
MYGILLALALMSGPQLNDGAKAHVLLFARTDCPLTDRYAPELRRIAGEFQGRGVEFWLVYPGRGVSETDIRKQIADYNLPGKWVRDPTGDLVRRSHVTVSPESAVFNEKGMLVYHGRIDDRWVDFGKGRPEATVHDLEDAINAVLAGKPVTHAATRAVGCSLADLE